MPNKSCQLGILKTATLKKVIDTCIPAVDQDHQSITRQRRILCKLENCSCETVNQGKTERHYTIKLQTSQQLKLHIQSS